MIEAVEVQHPRMLASVKERYPHLSENEVRHSLLIKLNYSPKEAAQLLGVTHNAVRMARKRLIKKLEIPEGMSLHEFLNHEKI
jgi:DNA-binding CsgD family transcriptional regulator